MLDCCRYNQSHVLYNPSSPRPSAGAVCNLSLSLERRADGFDGSGVQDAYVYVAVGQTPWRIVSERESVAARVWVVWTVQIDCDRAIAEWKIVPSLLYGTTDRRRHAALR